MSNLIPNLDKYYDNELNVLLVGLHGGGKSMSVMQFAAERGVKFFYASAALLDPWTDLTGIPTPRRLCPECKEWWPIEMRDCPSCHTKLGIEELLNVRPHKIDEAELVMLDEANRGDKKVSNALFELLQFKSINGERLPNLKCVWAAINPPDSGQYHVEDMDPALVDRFDIYINLNPSPSFDYMMKQGFKRENINAVFAWYKQMDRDKRSSEQVKNHISLRRIEKILRVYEATGDANLAIPPWLDIERNKLSDLLEKAREQQEKRNKTIAGGQFGKGVYKGFTYTPEWLEGNSQAVASYLTKHTNDIDTNKAIAEALSTKYGKTLAKLSLLDILESMNQTVVENMVDCMGDTKRDSFFQSLTDVKDNMFGDYPNINKIRDQFLANFDDTVEVSA